MRPRSSKCGRGARASPEPAAARGMPCPGPRAPVGVLPPRRRALPLAVAGGAQPFSARQVPVSTGKPLPAAQKPGNTRPAGAAAPQSASPAEEARAGLADSGCAARGAQAPAGLSASRSRAGDHSAYSLRCVDLGSRWGPARGGPSNYATIMAAGPEADLPGSDVCPADRLKREHRGPDGIPENSWAAESPLPMRCTRSATQERL